MELTSRCSFAATVQKAKSVNPRPVKHRADELRRGKNTRTLIVAGTVIAGSLVVRLIVVAVDEGTSSKTIPVPLGPGIGSSTIANWNEGATTDCSTLCVDL